MGTFHLHQSNRVERLVAALAGELEVPRGGAFNQEAVVVPGRGMGVWLSMELSKRLGVWATPLVYPRALVEDVARRVLGQNAFGAEPLSEELMEWALHAVLPGLLAEPDFAGLARYLAEDQYGVRLSELCRRLATVFDQGIGIGNVSERLKVLFGNQYRMWIESQPGEGTRTQIEVPELQTGLAAVS